MRDYTIYFATLILGVAIFYVFNAIEKQTVMMNVSGSTSSIIRLMNSSMSVISVFVSFVLGFLIIYASNFLMKRRKKEFGIYMILGMGKSRIARILLIETFIIGMVSLGVGLLVGVIASQGMSVIVANMFEADMTKFQFILSEPALLKTIAYFLMMYLVVMVFNTLAVSRTKLIHLLNARKKGEKQTAKNPVLCLIVFVVSAGVLANAYYNVTSNAVALKTEAQVVAQIVKGIVTTFLIFWSLSGLMLAVISKCKRFYYRKLNCFTVKELASRINTTIFSGSIICLMLFVTICVLSSAMSVKKSMDNNLKSMVPLDLNLVINMSGEESSQIHSVSEVLDAVHVDTSKFCDVVELTSYWGAHKSFTMADTLGGYLDAYVEAQKQKEDVEEQELKELMDYAQSVQEEIVRVSDYNRAARAYGIKEYTLAEDEYIMVANFGSSLELRNGALAGKTAITLGGKTYQPKYGKCQEGYLHMSSNRTNFGFILVPDSADLSGFEPYSLYYLANYKADSEEERSAFSKMIDSEAFQKQLNPENKTWPAVDIDSRTQIYANSIGLSAMMVFIGVYLGVIFMIASAAILALKELSEASDNREKYQMLRKIGVDEKMLHRSLFTQSLVFFGLPLVFACIHSIFGIQTCVYILETFGTTGIVWSILVTAGMILAVYGLYFMITYLCNRRMIKE